MPIAKYAPIMTDVRFDWYEYKKKSQATPKSYSLTRNQISYLRFIYFSVNQFVVEVLRSSVVVVRSFTAVPARR
jgi:hypothetical protein